jgi:hypothetical protein
MLIVSSDTRKNEVKISAALSLLTTKFQNAFCVLPNCIFPEFFAPGCQKTISLKACGRPKAKIRGRVPD